MWDLGFEVRRLRNAIRAKVPYVSRRRFNRTVAQYRALVADIAHTPRASSARVRVLKEATGDPTQREICLFVTHALRADLKQYVVDYIEQLLDNGIDVVLIANTDVEDAFHVEPVLLQRLYGAYVRENLGFDFAAWSHARLLSLKDGVARRLYLVNDSMVGPLDSDAFRALIARVRASSADVLGLTDNVQWRPHLQSYFLAFTPRAQQSAMWRAIFDDALAFASKESVIMIYETQVTELLEGAGLSTQCLFPRQDDNPRYTSYLHFRWQELVERGMPFIKASVVREQADNPAMATLVPEAYWRDLAVPRVAQLSAPTE